MRTKDGRLMLRQTDLYYYFLATGWKKFQINSMHALAVNFNKDQTSVSQLLHKLEHHGFIKADWTSNTIELVLSWEEFARAYMCSTDEEESGALWVLRCPIDAFKKIAKEIK